MTDDNAHFKIKWEDLGREPQVPPNPHFPNGIDLDVTLADQAKCKVMVPYPAPRCGYYAIRCTICGYQVSITTAGRPDDPRSVTIPCKQRTRH